MGATCTGQRHSEAENAEHSEQLVPIADLETRHAQHELAQLRCRVDHIEATLSKLADSVATMDLFAKQVGPREMAALLTIDTFESRLHGVRGELRELVTSSAEELQRESVKAVEALRDQLARFSPLLDDVPGGLIAAETFEDRLQALKQELCASAHEQTKLALEEFGRRQMQDLIAGCVSIDTLEGRLQRAQHDVRESALEHVQLVLEDVAARKVEELLAGCVSADALEDRLHRLRHDVGASVVEDADESRVTALEDRMAAAETTAQEQAELLKAFEDLFLDVETKSENASRRMNDLEHGVAQGQIVIQRHATQIREVQEYAQQVVASVQASFRK